MKPSIQAPLDALAARCAALEAQAQQIRGLIVALSGTVRSADVYISGTMVALSGAAGSSVVAVSSTLDAARAWNGLDPLRGTFYFDDFITDKLTEQVIGGAANITYQPWVPGHPGILGLTSATSGAVAEIIIDPVASVVGVICFGGGPIEYEACVRYTVLESAGQTCFRMTGLQDFGTRNDGAWLESSLARFGDTEYRLCTAATGSRSFIRTGVTPTVNLWHRCRINVAPDGDAVTGSIFASGVLLSQVSTQTYVPTSFGSVDVRPGIRMEKSAGGSTMATHVDYHYFQQTFTGSRT